MCSTDINPLLKNMNVVNMNVVIVLLLLLLRFYECALFGHCGFEDPSKSGICLPPPRASG